MTSADLAITYLLSVVVGAVVVNVCLWGVRKTINHSHEFFDPLSWWVGAVERAVATTLTLLAPQYLATFIGGWVALKFAANWQRYKGTKYGEHSLVALIGSVLSFAFAIGATLYMRPDLLGKLTAAH